MEISEIRAKTKQELQKMCRAEREKLRSLRFDIKLKQSKNVREIRKARKLIARILTILNAKKGEITKN
ncbi:50S ribosomal protein L29 [Candidatus Parcubacteria bacterium 4484_255]|nr:MAG: 50S ribosomal protein L29 [Candidatus Parcubacteria bacterium 4484_255]